MDDMTLFEPAPKAKRLSRRRFLAAFLTLAAYLRLTRPSLASQEDETDETVLSGRWLLKRSDLR
jgi:hypothetical protein